MLYLRFFDALFAGLCLGHSILILQIITKNPISNPSSLGFDGISLFFIFLLSFFPPSSFLLFLLHFLFSFFIFFYKIFDINRGLILNLFLGSSLLLIHFFSYHLGTNLPQKLWFGQFKDIDSINSLLFISISLLLITTTFITKKKLFLLTLGSQIQQNLYLKTGYWESFFYFLAFLFNALVISYFGFFSFFSISLAFFTQKLSFYPFLFFSGIFMLFTDFFSYFIPVYNLEIPSSLLASFFSSILLFFMYINKKQNKS